MVPIIILYVEVCKIPHIHCKFSISMEQALNWQT